MKTKLSVGDKVWVLNNNVPAKCSVRSVIKITDYPSKDSNISYELVRCGFEYLPSEWVDNNKVFKTKKELLESL